MESNDPQASTTCILLGSEAKTSESSDTLTRNAQVDALPTPLPSNTESSETEAKQSRRDILCGFQAVIKAQEERGVATAMGRKVRWESRQPGRQSAAELEAGTVARTGNAANAQQVAENEAKKV